MQNQLRIQIDNGEIQYLPDLGFHLMESPDILIPEQREYEIERYPEHDGVSIYPYTTYEPFEYTCKLLFFGTLAEMNTAVRLLWDSFFEIIVYGGARRAREIRIFNDYKGIQTVGYAMSMPGEDTYVQTLGDGINDKDSAWQCDLTIYVANPSKCVWSSDIALITYQLNGATPNTAQQQVRVGNTVVLPPPESLGMWLPPGFEFDGWYMDGMEVQSVEVIGNVTLVGRVQYGEDAFTVSPVRLEVAYDNTSRHPIAVSCPNNTWTVSAADPSWATVIKISQAQAGITLSQNNSTEDRSQAITFTWTAPDGTTIIRTVDVTQAIYLEVIGEITATIRVVGVDTGSGVQGMTVQLLIDGEIVASGITNAQGIWNSSWTEEQRHWEAVQNIEFAVSENAQYNGTMVALSQKPLFNDAVTNGINYGSATVSRKTQYVQLAYSLPQATPSVVQRQVVSGQQTTLESIASLGMVLPNYMDFDSWRVNGVVQTTITPTANTSVIGIATYNDNALIVTPTLIEHGDNDPTARTVSVTCVDNLWSITAGDPSWVTATKINQNTASIVFAQNTSTTERSQDITVSWTSSYGDRLTRNIVAIQLPRIEVLENIPLGVELVSSEDGTSFAGVDVDFFATLNGTESKIASGITDGNGEWSGTWRISAESYANVSLVKMTAGANTYIIFPYSLRWNAGFNLPTFNGAKGGAYNTGVIEADAYGDSYIIYTDEAGGGRLRFYSHDAPLANFSTTSSSGTSTIVVRGITITKSNVKEIFFGSSYDGTTALPNNFLRGFTSLISSPLKSSWRPTALPDYLMASCSSITQIIFPSEWAIIAIGSYVFSSCSKAEQIILPQEWTVGNIGSHFLYACSSLGSLIFPDTWPITVLGGFFLALDVNLMNLYMGNRQSWANVSVGTNAFFNMNQSTRTHHHETYEQAMAFKAKFSNTSNWAFIPLDSILYLTDGSQIPFSSDTTPWSRFTNVSLPPNGTIGIGAEDTRILKTQIRGIKIGQSYQSESSGTTGPYFFYMPEITTLDLSGIPASEIAKGSIMEGGGGKLTSISIGSMNAGALPGTYSASFNNEPNISSSTIYAATQQLGQTFRSKFANLSNWQIALQT